MLCWLLLLSGGFPLFQAWRANRQTTLIHAVNWAIGAWAAWCMAAILMDLRPGQLAALATYMAMCLTGCVGIAVLGARRPGAGAWNFVVMGLLLVLLLPVAEGWGELTIGPMRAVFLSATIAVGVLNYLPTRFWLAVLALAQGCAFALATLILYETGNSSALRYTTWTYCLMAMSPWIALVLCRRKSSVTAEFDRLWLGFRDRYGLVWSQRTREQFNRAALHAGWPVILRWHGLRLRPGAAMPTQSAQEAMAEALRALLKRFRADP